MASRAELAEMLSTRFKGVPNVDMEDCAGWIDRSLLEHGFRLDQDVPDNDRLLIIMYAEWDGTLQIALRTSYYFDYKDGDESVDQRMVSEAYRNMADQLYKVYERKKNETGRTAGPRFRVMSRADRPIY